MTAKQFLNNKGIGDTTLERFASKVEHAEEVVKFNYPEGYKVRSGDDFRTFKSTGKMGLWHLPRTEGLNLNVAYIVEGETDALVTAQEFPFADVYALSGVTNVPDLSELRKYDYVNVILDNEDESTPGYTPGHGLSAHEQVELAWRKISQQLPNAIRVRLPSDVQDACEFWQSYDHEAMRVLLDQARESKESGALIFPELDFHIDPPEPDWLVDGIIAKGDLVLFTAEPNVGKTMVMMSLAIAIAEGHKHWCGWKLGAAGPVMIADKENPVDDIYRRLHAFGTTDTWKDQVHYLHYPNVMLDRNPDDLVNHARAVRPRLILLDSLTRFHSKDENNAGEMGVVLNAITPLAREIGAAVVIIHHDNKGDGNNQYKRARGSGDISALPDTGLHLSRADVKEGRITLTHSKARRGRANMAYDLEIIGGDGTNMPLEVRRAGPPVF